MHTVTSYFSPCTGQDLPYLEHLLPDWAHWLVFPCAKWSAAPDPSHWEAYQHVEHLPEVSSLQWLSVTDSFGLPRSKGSVWVLFKPPLSEVNGWQDQPEELARSGLVRVELIEILSRQEREAWISVRVLEVRLLTELLDLWPPRSNANPLPQWPDTELMFGDERHLVQWGDLAYCWSDGDDEFTWVLCQRQAGHWHLLMHADWWYLVDTARAGHRLLSAEESAYLGLPGATS